MAADCANWHFTYLIFAVFFFFSFFSFFFPLPCPFPSSSYSLLSLAHGFFIFGFVCWLSLAFNVVLESPVSRPVQDWKKTGPRPVFKKTAVLGFQILKQNTAERPVYMDQLRPVETGLLCPSITPSKVAQEHVNWLKTD